MNCRKLLRTIVVLHFSLLFIFCAIGLAQDDEFECVENGNWIYHDYALCYEYKNYSKEDVAGAQLKFGKIKADIEAKSDEWTGKYIAMFGGEVNRVGLIYSPQNGYVRYNVYTCRPTLRSVSYGDVSDEPTVLWTKPVYSLNTRRKTADPTKYIKVKWGEKHLLVEESDLKGFLNKIVGLNLPTVDEDGTTIMDWYDVWEKEEDNEKTVTGLPVLPPEYVKLLPRPIEAKIIAVSKRIVKKIEDEYNDEPRYESHVPVTINVGAEQGVKVGMTFRIISQDEQFEITRVERKKAFGVIKRDLDENGRETFYDSESETYKPYPKVTSGWRLTTKPDPETLSWY